MNKYLKPITNFLKKNDWNFEEEDFIDLQYDIVDEMETDKVGFEITKDILELMENNPLVEFGTPGPFTHFIESFYNAYQEEYEKVVINSVKEKPSVHTIWLLNRLINGSEEGKAQELLKIIKSISKNEKMHHEIQKVAREFLE